VQKSYRGRLIARKETRREKAQLITTENSLQNYIHGSSNIRSLRNVYSNWVQVHITQLHCYRLTSFHLNLRFTSHSYHKNVQHERENERDKIAILFITAGCRRRGLRVKHCGIVFFIILSVYTIFGTDTHHTFLHLQHVSA
jgi:hypothetical protein